MSRLNSTSTAAMAGKTIKLNATANFMKVVITLYFVPLELPRPSPDEDRTRLAANVNLKNLTGDYGVVYRVLKFEVHAAANESGF